MEQVCTSSRSATNRGQLRGQKPPLKAKEIWAIRIRLQIDRRVRDLALFNLAIDSKLLGCDLVAPISAVPATGVERCEAERSGAPRC